MLFVQFVSTLAAQGWNGTEDMTQMHINNEIQYKSGCSGRMKKPLLSVLSL